MADTSLLQKAAAWGYTGVDLLDEHLWPKAVDLGLEITAVAGHHSLTEGLNRRDHAKRIENELRLQIKERTAVGHPPAPLFFRQPLRPR
jgi:sugar phosphate isomerase/epimerase